MNIEAQRNDCEVAVIGAGPYGLSVAAHLRDAGIETRVFGEPMSFWRDHMPSGMKLRSEWHATHLSDPQRRSTLDVFGAEHDFAKTYPLPLQDFMRYGLWFQQRHVPELDRRKVIAIHPAIRGFRLTLADGDLVHVARVVVALGLQNQDFRPVEFKGQPASLVSHSCDHVDLSSFKGLRVGVIGRGQSATESAVLLAEVGAEVELISRGPVHWIGSETASVAPPDGLKWKLHKALTPPSGVGPFPLNWTVEVPGAIHRLPAGLRALVNTRSLRPAAAAWLKPRAGKVRIDAGRIIRGVVAHGGGIALQLDNGVRAFDHVLLATGYHIDIARLGLLSSDLLARVTRTNGSPVLRAGLESSVAGLHFVGASAVASFGPIMRFVAGVDYAAHAVARAVRRDRRPVLLDA